MYMFGRDAARENASGWSMGNPVEV